VLVPPTALHRATAGDRTFFVYQHEKSGFSYAAAEAATGEYAPAISSLLTQLEPLLRGTAWQGAPCLNAWGASMDDVLLLPILRNLSCVKAVEWPPRVQAYVEQGCAAAGVNTFFATAC
jgi:glutaredoxin 2